MLKKNLYKENKMKLLLVGPYKKFNTNDYLQLLADAYLDKNIEILFDEQNFLFSNFIPDVVHLQWPESLYKWENLINADIEGYKLLKKRLQYYKKNNSVLIQTIHNILPHDSNIEFDKKVYNLIFDYIDIAIHHGESSINIIKELYPQTKNIKHIIAPHGPYERLPLPDSETSKNKYELPLNKLIITNFGLQRPYKGQLFSYEVLKKWNHDNFLYFSIGRVIGEQNEELKNSSFYKQVNKALHKSEVPEIISITDIFFLGHLSGLNSGAISLALTYEKPIVFPDIGNFKDQTKGWDLFETYKVGDIDSAINALNRIIDKVNDKKINKSNKKWLKYNSWESHIENIISAVYDIQ